MISERIKQLLALQDRDLEIDRLETERAAIPGEIESLRSDIARLQSELEAAKKDLTRLQLARKEKEVDLETKEGVIRKHSGELNAVKTNEAYRALLGEIDKAKSEQSALEDEILQIMEQMDEAQKVWKQKEGEQKTAEQEKKKQIADCEQRQADLTQALEQKKADRQQAAGALGAKLGSAYERIRTNKKRGSVVVPVQNEQCSGCHMRVSQNQINEIRRGQTMIVCENCSRIIYLAEVAAS